MNSDRAGRPWGDDEPEPRDWSSGLWSLELRGDELAYLSFDGAVVLRGIKAVIRDRDWGTVPSQAVAVTATWPWGFQESQTRSESAEQSSRGRGR